MTPTRGRIWWEIGIVLGLSFGLSALYSIVSVLDKATRPTGIGGQTTSINPVLNQRELFDFLYRILDIAGQLVPVALVVFLLWQTARPHLGRLGIDFTRPGRDTLQGLGLALLIGAGGLVVYVLGRATGLTADVVASSAPSWWVYLVLVLRAATAGISEEVIVIGYLFARLRDLGWRDVWIVIATALLRGSYHLYQGIGSFVGNVIMGLLFGWIYTRTGRLLPFVIAHFVIDAAIFIGYPWAAATFPDLLLVPTPTPTPTPTATP